MPAPSSGTSNAAPTPTAAATLHVPVKTPRVSVIVPVWNVEPWLRQCIDSILGQSLGDGLELIAVDDGSTDGSGAILDEYAARDPRVHVVHQPNSGGPGKPRNVGLSLARGRYVFFVDADDWLGDEALERLADLADANGSDVVLAKLVGVDGRLVPTTAFHRDIARAPLELVYSTLNVLKLFRRDHVERLGLRFDETVASAEDAPFTMRAYLEAETISVLGSYDAYYCRLRRGSQSTTTHGESLLAHLRRIRGRIDMLEAHTRPGPRRDLLMARHAADVGRTFRRRWSQLDEAERRAVFDAAVPLAHRCTHRLTQARSAQWLRLRTWCLAHDRYRELVAIAGASGSEVLASPVVEGRRVFAPFPGFRDGSGIPDSCYEITRELVVHQAEPTARVEDGVLRIAGEAYLANAKGSPRVFLQRVPGGRRVRVPATPVRTPHLRDRHLHHDLAGFEVRLDLARANRGRAVPAGLYRVELTVGSDAVARTVPARAGSGVHRADRLRRAGTRTRDAWRLGRGPALHADASGNLYLAVPPLSRVAILAVRALSLGSRVTRTPRRIIRRVTALAA